MVSSTIIVRCGANLPSLGIRFRTESDTEVLANALQVWGEAALERFAGMYAFVAIDTASGEFIAARDPFGVKPLYLIQSDDGLYFCSEIRPLLQAVEAGEVMLVPPGYVLSSTDCGRFNSPIRPMRATHASPIASQTLDRLLVRGGAGAAAARIAGRHDVQRRHRQHPRLPIMCAGSAPTRPDISSATSMGRTIATRWNMRTRRISICGVIAFDADSEEVFSQIDRVVEVTESFEPNLIRGAVCSLAVAERMHHDGFRVALCGEGADELFCGYPPLELAFHEGYAEGAPSATNASI